MPPLVVDWVLSGDRDKASSRLQGFKIHEWLVSQGVGSRIVATNFNELPSATSKRFIDAYNTIRLGRATHVVFEAPEWIMVQLAQLCARLGKVAVAVRCDLLGGDYDRSFDRTIVPTAGLAQQLGIRRAAVIDDMLDIDPEIFKVDYESSRKLRVVWVGHPNYADYLAPLIGRLRAIPTIEQLFDFDIVSRGPFATVEWNEATVSASIIDRDIAWIPIPAGHWYQNKSSNRLAMMHSLAMPVVASRIPSYDALARHGINGFYVEDEDGFAPALLELADAALRARLGRQARADVGSRFRPDVVARQWFDALSACSREPEVARGFSARLAGFAGLARLVAPFRRSLQR